MVFISLTGGSNFRGGNTRGGNLRLPPPKHSHAVPCIQAHYGPVSGGDVEGGLNDGQTGVGEVWVGLVGGADSGLGYRKYVGGGRRWTGRI